MPTITTFSQYEYEGDREKERKCIRIGKEKSEPIIKSCWQNYLPRKTKQTD